VAAIKSLKNQANGVNVAKLKRSSMTVSNNRGEKNDRKNAVAIIIWRVRIAHCGGRHQPGVIFASAAIELSR